MSCRRIFATSCNHAMCNLFLGWTCCPARANFLVRNGLFSELRLLFLCIIFPLIRGRNHNQNKQRRCKFFKRSWWLFKGLIPIRSCTIHAQNSWRRNLRCPPKSSVDSRLLSHRLSRAGMQHRALVQSVLWPLFVVLFCSKVNVFLQIFTKRMPYADVSGVLFFLSALENRSWAKLVHPSWHFRVKRPAQTCLMNKFDPLGASSALRINDFLWKLSKMCPHKAGSTDCTLAGNYPFSLVFLHTSGTLYISVLFVCFMSAQLTTAPKSFIFSAMFLELLQSLVHGFPSCPVVPRFSEKSRSSAAQGKIVLKLHHHESSHPHVNPFHALFSAASPSLI